MNQERINEILNRVYDVLVGVGADESRRPDFVIRYASPAWLWQIDEWRFCGQMGQGGKFHVTGSGFVVSCYPEDMTVARHSVLVEVNAALKSLFSEYETETLTEVVKNVR